MRYDWLAAIGIMLIGLSSHAAQAEQWRQQARCGGFLEAPTRLPNGDLAVSDPLGGRIFRVDAKGACRAIVTGLDLPNGLALRQDGQLVVAIRGGLMLVDPSNGRTSMLVDQYDGQKLGIANDLAIDSHGGIYFTVPGRSSLLQPDGRVFYLPSGKREAELIADGLAFPNGIAVAPDGDSIRIAEFAAKRVLSVPTRHSKRQFNVAHVFAHTQGGVGPDGLSFGPDGVLYAANIEAGTISRWTPEGRLLADFRLPKGAGLLVTNVLIERDWLYATEASQGAVWKLRLP